MFEEYNINPYPGLRSFTEEESVYFKGRDEQVVKIIGLLEMKKFLMVTGASGDGKSSLIYAGLIPSARAGFFRATYSNWSVVSFRPERSPVRNFARALAPELGVESGATVETELNRGFSALIDLYKSSELYFDSQSEQSDTLSDEEKQDRIRTSKNLLVIVDQFEEFFTNPENYANQVPSQESVVLVNLLLETARISLKEGLPIYVVCTMRSDFIGQCAAFRGLPEYIGFSQFFVPRLKRRDLQQVIEEPAVLSGNQISKRLVERLIYDLDEGVDQLPILQHALNQIWIQADERNEEMDLIHYAKVGGMPAEELPENDQFQFSAWFDQLPELEQQLYQNTGLQQVLDIHANKLYQDAYKYYNRHHPEDKLDVRETKRIVAMAFACLTKIDQSRAVRNRMTLKEITRIINDPGLSESQVGGVINYFREPGNTFIRPFIGSNGSGDDLGEDEVLDITHESLIRNWARLDKWALKEFEYYQTFLDFQKQLTRWVESGKSRDHYLPIGPLIYFEKWFKECRPNQYWINRYNEEEQEPEEKLQESGQTLELTRNFLQRSANRLVVTRTFMKYGARRIAAFFAVLAVMLLSGFYYLDAERKLNQRVLKQVEALGKEILAEPEADEYFKGQFLVMADRVRPGAAMAALAEVSSPQDRVTAAFYGYLELLAYDNHFEGEIKLQLANQVNQLLSPNEDYGHETKFLLQRVNAFLNALSYDYYFNQEEDISRIRQDQVMVLKALFLDLLEQPQNFNNLDPNDFGIALDHLVGNLAFDAEERTMVLSKLSPFADGRQVFDLVFPANVQVENGDFGSLTHKGGYHNLAVLYASAGDLPNTFRCLDSLLKYDPAYLSLYFYNNAYCLAGHLVNGGNSDKVPELMQRVSDYSDFDLAMAYNYLLDRSGHLKYFYSEKFDSRRYDPVLSLLTLEQQDTLFEQYFRAINDRKDPLQRQFQMALALKQRAVFYQKYSRDKEMEVADAERLRDWLDQSLALYRSLPTDFLRQQVDIDYRYYTIGFRQGRVQRSHLYLYPDHYNNGWTSDNYYGGLVTSYWLEKGIIDELFTEPEDFELLNQWVRSGTQMFIFEPHLFRNTLELDRDLVIQTYEKIRQLDGLAGEIDLNLMKLVIANHLFHEGDSARALEYAMAVDTDMLGLSSVQGDYLDITFFYNELTECATSMALMGENEKVAAILDSYSDPNRQLITMSKISMALHRSGRLNSLDYLDQLFEIRTQVREGILTRPDYRISLLHTLGLIGGQNLLDLATDILIDVSPSVPLYTNKKEDAFIQFILGICQDGNYFRAFDLVSDDFSVTQELRSYNTILYVQARTQEDDEWQRFDFYTDQFFDRYVVFQDQN